MAKLTLKEAVGRVIQAAREFTDRRVGEAAARIDALERRVADLEASRQTAVEARLADLEARLARRR
jgi:hypothetical protein